MLIVHHLNNSRSQKILWILEELQVPYEIKKYQRNADQRAPPEMLAISPLGKSPVITDGDVNLAESGAIVEYVIAKYGNGKAMPTESGFLDNLYFNHYAEGSLMPIIVQKYIFDLIPKRAPFYIRPLLKMVFGQMSKQFIQRELKKHLTMVETHLGKSKSLWFAGGNEPTAADYQMLFPLELIVAVAPDAAGPNIKKFVQLVHGRDAYKRGVEKGGEYSLAKL